MVVYRSCCCIHRRIFGRGKYRNGRTCTGRISNKQSPLYWYDHYFTKSAQPTHIEPGSLSGLASQTTARQGNALGILGVSSGILASLAAVGFPPAVIAQFAAVAAVGGGIGSVIGRRVTATELPQTVAMLHSIVGLSAVLTSIGSVLADPAHCSNLHLITAYLGVVIGKTLPLLFSICS